MSAVSEPTCAKCGRDISLEERPWTFTGYSSEEFETEAGESIFVGEDCYDDLTAGTSTFG